MVTRPLPNLFSCTDMFIFPLLAFMLPFLMILITFQGILSQAVGGQTTYSPTTTSEVQPTKDYSHRDFRPNFDLYKFEIRKHHAKKDLVENR